jgi:hypothetical protein
MTALRGDEGVGRVKKGSVEVGGGVFVCMCRARENRGGGAVCGLVDW